jgi:hypothetical protein
MLTEDARRDITLGMALTDGADVTGLEATLERLQPGSSLPAAITNLYLNHALCFVADDKVRACAADMRRQGFWSVLGEDPDLVEGLAAFGLTTSFTDIPDYVESLLALHGISMKKLLGALHAHQSRAGYLFLVPVTRPAGASGPARVDVRCLV